MSRNKPLRPTAANVTLSQVAEACGVSPSTVSRVLSGSVRVSEAKQARVRQAVAALGFVPNTLARALADGRTRTIGLVAQQFESPFYAMLLRGVEEAVAAEGYALVVTSGHWDRAEEERCIHALRARRVDGIIVLTGQLEDGFLVDLARELPVVVTGRDLHAPGLHALKTDDHEGARLATRHLLALGHTRIAFIGGDPRHADAHERASGYRCALAEAGLPVDPALCLEGDYLEPSGAAAMETLLARGTPFTAVFAANDQMAFGAALALHRRGLHVPNEVSLVGFDDVATSSYTVPPLSSIHQPVYELGRLAATAMLDLLAGRPPEVALPAPHMVVRESTRRL
jgi:LacI family transcriptional regulator